MSLNWNVQRGEGFKPKKLCGRVWNGYFLEQHNNYFGGHVPGCAGLFHILGLVHCLNQVATNMNQATG